MTDSLQPTVGVIGLGNMGGLLAQCIARAGFRTLAYDIRREAAAALDEHGIIGCATVEDVLRGVDIACVVVLDETQAQAVADARAALDGGADVFIINSTVTPLFVQAVERQLKPLGVQVVDAAVAGGLARARTGQLTTTVGGEDVVVERIRPVLEAFARDIFHVGPAGAGSAMKLVVNFLTIAGYELQLEAMQLGAAYSLDEDTMLEVLVTSNADSRALHTWGVQDRARRSVPAGTTPVAQIMLKDLASATTAAAARGVVLPIAAVAAATVVGKLADRDAVLDERGRLPETPKCTNCGQELAAPFRTAGTHPECSP